MNKETLLQIANEYGSPVYVYDAHKMEAQYKRLTAAFSNVNKLKINYAAKALTNISVLKFINKLGAGLDTVSVQEVRLGLHAGFKPESIIYTPNGVSLEEIEEVAKLGVQINIDNLSILEQFGTKHPNTPVCIRINPHIMAGGNTNISVGHILYASEILFDVARQFEGLEFIDFGSGFKVPYKENDIETNIEELGEKLTERFHTFCKNYGKDVTLAFEPGKFIVSESGYFLTSVNAIKQTTSTVFAQVDTGFNHLIRPMLYGSQHTIENISNPKGKQRFYSVVGYICETDTFANNQRINEITEGDILVFKNAGAYCFMMASNYNSRFRPAEVLWYNDTAHLIRKREVFEDLTKNQLLIDL
jgi:diaminopimelate decarboxylase